MNKFEFKEETYQLIGASMEVHKELGAGFLEAVYQQAFAVELKKRNIPYLKEERFPVFYKDIKLEKYYIADFICLESVVVELKALSQLTSEHEAQLLNYLKVTGLSVGLLLNFGSKSLQYKRMVL